MMQKCERPRISEINCLSPLDADFTFLIRRREFLRFADEKDWRDGAIALCWD
jgi:hypothetical protein